MEYGATDVFHVCYEAACAAQTPALLPFPDLTETATAFPMYEQQGINPARVIRVGSVFLQACNALWEA